MFLFHTNNLLDTCTLKRRVVIKFLSGSTHRLWQDYVFLTFVIFTLGQFSISLNNDNLPHVNKKEH